MSIKMLGKNNKNLFFCVLSLPANTLKSEAVFSINRLSSPSAAQMKTN